MSPSAQIAVAGLALAGGGAVAGLAGALLPRGRALASRLLLLFAATGCAFAVAGACRSLFGSETGRVDAAWAVPSGAWLFRLDRLGAWFSLLSALLGAPVVLFATSYLRKISDSAFAAFCLIVSTLLASLVLLGAAAHGLLFLALWECMTLSAFFLVVLVHEDERVRWAGRLYILLNHSAALGLVALIAHLGSRAGSCSFEAMEAAARTAPGGWLPFGLALLGFGAKSGLLPLHIWLPHAHPAAPSPVSALLSGIVVKSGIFGFLRFLPMLPAPPGGAGPLLIGIGVLTMLFGALSALVQLDLKRVLAYSTVENLGILLAGAGLLLLGGGAAAQTAVLLHAAAHAIAKSLLFLGAGSILHAAGTTDLRRLGGLLRTLPFTATAFLLGSLSLAALPPLGGFAGEASLYSAFFRVATGEPASSRLMASVAIVALAATGGLGAAVAARTFAAVFLGPRREEAPAPHGEGPLRERAAMGLLAAGTLALGLLPDRASAALSGGAEGQAWIASIARAAASVTLLALLLAWVRRRLARGEAPARVPTWGCGYSLPGPRMQYTPTSFAAPLLRSTGNPVRATADVRRPEGVFPGTPSVRTAAPDAVERFLYRPLYRLFLAGSGAFRLMQRAPVQLQVLYVLALLALLLIGETLL